MKNGLTRLLRQLGFLSFDFLCKKTKIYPDVARLRTGDMIIVRDGEVMKWACFLCPGGCGASISLCLNTNRRPHWRVRTDFWGRPTIEPSIQQMNECGCHFFIRRGQVDWCKGGCPRNRK